MHVVVHLGAGGGILPARVLPLSGESEVDAVFVRPRGSAGLIVVAEGFEAALLHDGASVVRRQQGRAEVVGREVGPALGPGAVDRELGDGAAGEVEEDDDLLGVGGGRAAEEGVDEAGGVVEGVDGAGASGGLLGGLEEAPAIVREASGLRGGRPIDAGEATLASAPKSRTLAPAATSSRWPAAPRCSPSCR
jgi:hypothetical protein